MKAAFLSLVFTILISITHAQTMEDRYIDDNLEQTLNSLSRNLSMPNQDPNSFPVWDFGKKSILPALGGKLYSIVNLTIPTVASSFNLSKYSTIRLIDLRSDQQKIGFIPTYVVSKLQIYNTIGLNVQQSPLNWIKNWLETSPFTFDTTSNRKLGIILRDCWFSQDAFVPRHSASNSLVTTLNYHIDFFTQIGNEYFPQEKIKGAISLPYEDGKAYQLLLDSLQHVIEKDLVKIDEPPLSKRKIQAQEFATYINEIKSKKIFAMNPTKGVYESFEQFMDHSPITDSAIVIKSFIKSDAVPFYAIQLQPVVNGVEKSNFGIWGYFDGKNLFYNTGNGLFISLQKDETNGYFFPCLNLLSKVNIKNSLLSGVKFGNSDYSIIKEYARISPLTYKLNLSDGRLY